MAGKVAMQELAQSLANIINNKVNKGRGLGENIWENGSISDLNAILSTGWDYANGSALNKPAGVQDCAVLTTVYDGNWVYQMALDWYTNKMFTRKKQGGVWSIWQEPGIGGVETLSVSQTFNAIYHTNRFIYANNSSAITLTVPENSVVPFPVGTEITVFRYGAGEITFASASGATIFSESSKRRINAQYQAATIKKFDTNLWALIGALKT